MLFSRVKRAVPIVLLCVAVLYWLRMGPVFPRGVRLWDYAVVAASSYLWLHGEDPFDHAAVVDAWASRHPPAGFEDDVGWLRAIVPPPTLVVMSPFAALPLLPGALLYLAATIGLCGTAAWCCGRWANLRGTGSWASYLALLLTSVPAWYGLRVGNPVVLAVPLMLIGLYRSRDRDDPLGGVLLGLGTAVKIQIGVPLIVFWIAWRRWRTAGVAILLAAVLAGVGIVRMKLAGIDWWAAWVSNLAYSHGPGRLNDFAHPESYDDRLNLQVPIWWLTHSRAWANIGTYALWCVPAAIVALLVLRLRWGKLAGDPLEPAGETPPRSIVLLASAGVLLLIPVYHRAYDGIVLLPLMSAAVAGLQLGRPSVDRGLRRWMIVAIALMLALAVPPGVPGWIKRRGALPVEVTSSLFWRAGITPAKAWLTLALVVPCIVVARRMSRMSQRSRVANARPKT